MILRIIIIWLLLCVLSCYAFSRHNIHQRHIERKRIIEIQKALTIAGYYYYYGKPSGKLDDFTKRSLRLYQKDNGWQTKIVPDSRALILLGLGPDYSAAINADKLDAKLVKKRLDRD